MRFFDLHCDTLYKAVTDNSSLNNTDYEITIDKGKFFDRWRECTAIWIPDNITPRAGMELFLKAHSLLGVNAAEHSIAVARSGLTDNNYEFLFTVENGAFLSGNYDNIQLLKKCGVRMLTLTWNAENCIGGGADAQNAGITEFGKCCVKKLEQNSIVIDISHASDELFYDVCEYTAKPFVASHSSARAVCNHRRNLTNDQFMIIRDRGGIVGLNFHRHFLNNDGDNASLTDVLRHTEHFLSLGGENTICIGSDYDGSEVPDSLRGLEKIPRLYESFLKIGYNEQLVQKIMYDNAYNFFTKF